MLVRFSVKKTTLAAGALCACMAARGTPLGGQAPAPAAPTPALAPAAQSPLAPWSIARLDSALARAREAWDIPGMAVAVVRGDSVLMVKGYGVRELGKPGRVDANTIFDAASLTKSFTSAAIAMLVDDGRMRWDDPVRRHLPWLELGTPSLTSEVTIRDLLSHRPGLESANGAWYFTGIDRRELLRRMRFLRQTAPFRTTLVYSNIGYTAAGEASAAAAGMPWEELIRTRILDPLGMSRTTARFVAAATLPNVASPHSVVDGVHQPIAREGAARDVTAPAGAIQSSASDLARWLRFQLGGGTLDGRRLVSEAALRQTWEPQLIVPSTPEFRRSRNLRFGAYYGMGWQVWDYRGHPMLWHTGAGDGQRAWMAIYPEERLGVVVLFNSWVLTSAPPLHGIIAGCIADALLALAPPDCEGNARTLRAADSARYTGVLRAMESTRLAGTAPSRPLAAYAGTYADSLYGDLHVRLEGGRLTLQAGSGAIADLSHWHLDTFTARWRDPFQGFSFPTRVAFALDELGEPTSIRLRLRNDEVTAGRRREPVAATR